MMKIKTLNLKPKGGDMLKCYGPVLAILVVTLLVPQQVLAEGQVWGNDVLVHQADHIYGFGMDQGDKDTLYLVVADSSTTNLTDTSYIYRSTDNGRNWSLRVLNYSGRRGKADIIAAKGELDAIYKFEIIQKRLTCLRYSYDLTGVHFSIYISDLGEDVVDFAVCQDLFPDYWLYVVYQTDEDSVIFKRSRNFDTTWTDRANLTASTPIRSKPSVAWSSGSHLVVAGKTADNGIYTIRNTNSGNSADWQDGQYPSGLVDCDNPVVAGSHTSPADSAVFWVFYERYVPSLDPQRWLLQYHWSTDACSTWSSISSPSDTSTGNRVLPSLHVLEENDVSNLTLAYRYEIGAEPRQIRYIYKQNAQSVPSVWTVPYTGVNDYAPDDSPPHRAYTIRGTDNSIGSAVLYVRSAYEDLYFDAFSFTAVDNEVEDKPIRRFSLDQNYPNPFNPTTKIEFVLSKSEQVKIEIFNILGEKVKTLMDQHLKAGRQLVEWDGKDESGEEVASGVYFYRLQTKDFTQTKKMVLIR
jgi:hypothetical protein